jgi:hypothetical protein
MLALTGDILHQRKETKVKRQIFPVLMLLTMLGAMALGWSPSLQPIYTDEDIVFEPALAGTWTDDNGNAMEIVPSTDVENAYIITPVISDDESVQGPILAHLVKFSDFMFLDVYPGKSDADPKDVRHSLFLNAHAFLLVDQIEPELILRDMDAKWLGDYLDANPDALGHTRVRSAYINCTTDVITASTEDIQTFMVAHIGDEGAYGGPLVFHRATE